MEEWKEYKATDFCYKVTDGTHDSPNEVEKGKYLITSKHIKGNSIDYEKAYQISEEDYNKIVERSRVDQWDIIISMIGAYCGYCYIEKTVNTDYAIKNVGLFKVGEEIKCKWLYYYLTSPQGKQQLAMLRSGSTQPYISLSSLRNMTFPVPPLTAMKRIVSILSSLDDKIEVNRRINEQLEELAQALFKSWFVDFEPFKDGEFVESELGMIPKGWKVGKYTDMVEIKGGGTPKTDIPEYWNGEIPFFTPKDVNNNVYCIETEKNISELGLSKCSSKLYNKNTVFITARGTVGKVCMAGRNMAMNQTCYALLGKENYGQHFIYLQTINIVERMKKKANGAVFSAITTRDFDSEKIVIPPIEIVRNFSPKIESIYESILRNQQEITHLTTLRDTLLPKLMSGEIDVNEVEI